MKNPSTKSTETATLESSTLRPASGSGLRVRSKVRAGLDGVTLNHGLRVRSKIRAGGISVNHGLRVRGA
jgi:hypothetical protein